MLLNFLLMVSQAPADPVLDKFAEFVRNAKTLSVQIHAKRSGFAVDGTGEFRLQRPSRVHFAMNWNLNKYVFNGSEHGLLEIEHALKKYRESPAPGYIGIPNSTLSWVPDLGFPKVFVIGDFRKMVPRGATFSQIAANGDSKTVATTFVSGPSPTTVTAKIGADGRLLSYSAASTGMEAVTVELTFSNYVINGPITDSAFSLEVPSGYTPEYLPEDPNYLDVGDKPPLTGFSKMGSQQQVDLRKQYGDKPLLVIVSDPESEPSLRLLEYLDASANSLRSKGIQVAVIWTKAPSKSASKFDSYVDAQRSEFPRLPVAGTPTMFMIDPKGLVGQVWLGFDASIKKQYLKEILEAATRPTRTDF